MSVNDFRTTLAHLMRVCWAAAAGQLHLASLGDSVAATDDSTSSSPGPSPSSSVMEEGEREGQLRAGLCMEQADGTVSPKVCMCVCMYVCMCVLLLVESLK